MIEPMSGGKLELLKKVIGFDLPQGTTFEQAERICDFLNENIEQISET